MASVSAFARGVALEARPAQQQRQQRQAAVAVAGEGSSTSRVGKRPIPVPKGVTLKVEGQTVTVKGPKGQLQRTLSPLIKLEQREGEIAVLRAEDSRLANQQHGLSRTLISNMVVGVDTGFTTTLNMVGVGYKAAVAGSKLTLNLGYSHPIDMEVPKGIEVKVERNTTVVVGGFDKELVGQFAANIRSWREPEPYKGKGIKYSDEVVLRKEGKRGK